MLSIQHNYSLLPYCTSFLVDHTSLFGLGCRVLLELGHLCVDLVPNLVYRLEVDVLHFVVVVRATLIVGQEDLIGTRSLKSSNSDLIEQR